MKILHIIPSLHGGGAEKFTIDLCNELSREHGVIVCSLFDVDDTMFMAKNLQKNIKLVTLNKKSGFDISIFFKIYKLIKDEKVDIVNTHLRALLYSILPVIFTNTNFFHTVHNMAQNETGKMNRLVYKMFFQLFNVTPVAISKKVLKSIQNEYGKKFNVLIENGIKKPEKTSEFSNVQKIIDGYKVNKETKVFINIGRISPQKNQKMLINVFNDLISKGENVLLLIIGEADTLENKSLNRKLCSITKDKIYFLGMKENVSDFLACSDAFCLSSLYEGLPITLLEALAMGIVPICTPAGGIVDVLDKNTGIVTEDFSEEKYQAAIYSFLNSSKEDIECMKTNGQKLFHEKYEIQKTAEKYLKVYSKPL